MNKYLTSALVGIGTGLIGYVIGGKKGAVSGAIVGIGGSLYINKRYKKHVSSLKKQVEEDYMEEERRLIDAGIIPDQSQQDDQEQVSVEASESNSVEQNDVKPVKEVNEETLDKFYDTSYPLTYRILNLLKHSPSWSDDDINGSEDLFYDWDNDCYSLKMNHSEYNMVHVLNKEHKNRHFLEFLVHVPPYVKKGSNATPKLKNYRDTLVEFTNQFWETNNLKNRKPSIFVRGYYSEASPTDVINIIQNGDVAPVESFKELTDDIYNSYATVIDGKRLPDGLAKMVSYFSDENKLNNSDYLSVSHYVVIEVEVNDIKSDKGIDKLKLLQYMHEMMDIYVYQDNGDGKQLLGPFAFHPGKDLGVVYNMNLEQKHSILYDPSSDEK